MVPSTVMRATALALGLALAAGCTHANDPPVKSVAIATPRELVAIADDFPAALAKAKAEGKPLFVDVWAPWCHTCLSLRAYVLSDPAFVGRFGDKFVFATIDTEKDQNQAFVASHPVEAWPTLLRIARSDRATTKARKAAIFWVGQAAADEATKGLDDLANDNDQDREVRESALFALSQQPASKGIPALIRVAKTSKDPKLRRTALFWLGQSEDPAAIRLFEEILAN